MATIEFVIVKINGVDINEISQEDAIQMFLKDSEPIIVEIRHKNTEFFKSSSQRDYPVTSFATNYISKYNNEEQIIQLITDIPQNLNNTKNKKTYSSIAVQTDVLASNTFEECFSSEIDIEEITLRKSTSADRIGLTVSYSSAGGNGSGSDNTDSGTEIYISDIIPNSVAARDGRLRQGDQILQVNGCDVLNKEETESLIAENKNAVTLLISRCLYTDDFQDALEEYDDDDHNSFYENDLIENTSSERTNTSSTRTTSSKKGLTKLSTSSEFKNDKTNLIDISNTSVASNIQQYKLIKNKSFDNDININNKESFSNYHIPLDRLQPKKLNNTNQIDINNIEIIKKQQIKNDIESDTEHIYETIPDDSEYEPFYCLPYEKNDSTLVQKWLEMQQNQITEIDINKTKLLLNKNNIVHNLCDNKVNNTLILNNDQIAIELNQNTDGLGSKNSRSLNTLHSPARFDDSKRLSANTNETVNKSFQRKKDKASPKHKPDVIQPTIEKFISSQQAFNTSKSADHQKLYDAHKPFTSNTMYTNMENLQQTMLLQQRIFRQALTGHELNQEQPTFTAPNLSQYHFVSSQEVSTAAVRHYPKDEQMEWKVKRRPDGTRYIVRRPVRQRNNKERNNRLVNDRNENTTEDDISEIKIGRFWTKEERKKHVERAKERRHKLQQTLNNANINDNDNNKTIALKCYMSTMRISQQAQQQQLHQQQAKTNDTHMCKKISKIKLKNYDDNECDDNNKQLPQSSNKTIGILSVTTV